MNNIKVIRLGNNLDWDHSINCSIKKYNSTINLLEFSEFLKRFFSDNDIQKEYQIKYSHCRLFNKGKEIFVKIYLQDLNYISAILKDKKRKFFYKKVLRKYLYTFLRKKVKINIKKKRLVKQLLNKINYKFLYKKEMNKIRKKCHFNKNFIKYFQYNKLRYFLHYVRKYVKKERKIMSRLARLYRKNRKFLKYKKIKLRLISLLLRRIKKLLFIYKKIKKYNKKFYRKKFFSLSKKSIFFYKKKLYKFKYIFLYKNLIRKNILDIVNKRNKKKKQQINIFKGFNDKLLLKKRKAKPLLLLNKFQIFQFMDFEEQLLNASYFYFKKKVTFKYYFLNDYILTSNSIVQYICDRLKQEFSLNEILKDVKYVLLNSKDIIGFRIDCSGRFGRKQRTSFKRLSSGNLSKSKINAIVDYSMNFVILKYGCCNIKVLLHKNKNYREYKYNLKIY